MHYNGEEMGSIINLKFIAVKFYVPYGVEGAVQPVVFIGFSP